MNPPKFPHPDNPGEALVLVALEVLEILAVWFVALRVYQILDVLRLKFRPREFWAWLQTPEGSFAEYVARTQRESERPEAE